MKKNKDPNNQIIYFVYLDKMTSQKKTIQLQEWEANNQRYKQEPKQNW